MYRSRTQYSGYTKQEKATIYIVTTGFKQEHGLYQLLFNRVLVKKIRTVKEESTLRDHTSIIEYANDIDVGGRTAHDISCVFLYMKEVAQIIGPTITGDKTEHIVITRHNQDENLQHLETDKEKNRKKKNYKYMITVVNYEIKKKVNP